MVLESKYKLGEIVYEKTRPSQKMVIERYENRVYYCKVTEAPHRKALVYLERDIATYKPSNECEFVPSKNEWTQVPYRNHMITVNNLKQNKMKALKLIGALLALIVGTQLLTACSGYIVATGPPSPPVEVIVVAPSPRYVWVDGYYSYNRSAYVWVEGSYQIPPRGRTTYVQGHWQQTPKGYKRGRGYWR